MVHSDHWRDKDVAVYYYSNINCRVSKIFRVPIFKFDLILYIKNRMIMVRNAYVV